MLTAKEVIEFGRYGFTLDQVNKILSNNGGSKNLAALQQLLHPVLGQNGQPITDQYRQLITQLKQIIDAGFKPESIVSVLSNNGGSKNLAALQQLLHPVLGQNGQPIADQYRQPITQLKQIIDAGFKPESIVSVLSHGGGSKNLAALQQLLEIGTDASGMPMFDGDLSPITQLKQIIDAGFKPESIVSVLSHGGGSKNLAALQQLLHPVLGQNGQPITKTAILKGLGIGSDNIINILSKPSGSNAINQLYDTLQENYCLFKDNPRLVKPLVELANTKAKAKAIETLRTKLKDPGFKTIFSDHADVIIANLKKIPNKDLVKITIEQLLIPSTTKRKSLPESHPLESGAKKARTATAIFSSQNDTSKDNACPLGSNPMW